MPFDYGRFAERFRGSEDYVKKNIQFYLPRFEGRGPVLDIGCGRGEILELMRDAGIEAHGVDLSTESVARRRQKGLAVEQDALFDYLREAPGRSLGGLLCDQVLQRL